MEYNIELDAMNIITENAGVYSKVYKEAAAQSNKGPEEAQAQVEKFTKSINQAYGSPDKAISASKGNIKAFKSLEAIDTTLRFLNKTLTNNAAVKDLEAIKQYLIKYTNEYQDGYKANVKLVSIEYEACMDILITGITFLMVSQVEMKVKGVAIQAQKKTAGGASHGIILNNVRGVAKELANSNHQGYLRDLIRAKQGKSIMRESFVFEEGATLDVIKDTSTILSNLGSLVSDGWKFTVNGWKTLKASMFGILPIIRSIIYLRYKKKANTIMNLEEQAKFIRINIEQVKGDKSISEADKPAIIKKQEAYIEAYMKKAEKLRAELADAERSAAIAIKDSDSGKQPEPTREPEKRQEEKPKQPSSTSSSTSTSSTSSSKKDDDDDFVLESIGG